MTHTPANENAGRSCICHDPDVEQLRRLIAEGIPQADASRIIWSPDQPPTNTSTPVIQAYVRARLKRAFPWLRLPPRKVA